MKTTAALMTAACILASSEDALAVYARFCITHSGAYDDNENSGYYPHDYWTDDLSKYARGQQIFIYRNGADLWHGNLYDGLGGTPLACTPMIAMLAGLASFEFVISSSGVVNGNQIEVRGPGNAEWQVSDTESRTIADNRTYTVEITITDTTAFRIMNVYQAAAYALYRHNGGMNGETVRYQIDDAWFHSAYYCDGSPPVDKCPLGARRVMLWPSSGDHLFTIVHETGHLIADLMTQAVFDADTIDVSYDAAPCSASTHSDTSEEWAGGAAGEGFADFYAADVFNNHDETDCGKPYYVGAALASVNCQVGTAYQGLYSAYHQNFCGNDAYRGVELDWTRSFWNVHTAGAAPDPSFTAIVSWLDTAGNFTRETVYPVLDDEADDLNGDLEANWNATKFVNGVDY